MSAFRLPAIALRPIEIEERKPITLTREVEILRRFVVCAGCGERMTKRSDYQYDHEIALQLGGKDDPSNMRPYCVAVCHPKKTALDIKLIAKAKRLAGETCTGPSRRPIKSRGFDKTKSKKFNGEVVTR